MSSRQIETLKKQVGLALVRQGRLLLDIDQALAEQRPTGPSSEDTRPAMTTELTVILSHHAIDRYGERTGRELGRTLQVEEIRHVWPHAEITSVPPDWHKPTREHPAGTLYAEIADLLIPLVPYERSSNTYVATTVLSKLGDRGAKRAGSKLPRRVRSGAKFKRRKWSDGPRRRPEDFGFDA